MYEFGNNRMTGRQGNRWEDEVRRGWKNSGWKNLYRVRTGIAEYHFVFESFWRVRMIN
jgi:hypothetical protein